MKAFGCDLCKTLEPGAPVATFALKPVKAPATEHLELCEECIASFYDWRASRDPAPASVDASLLVSPPPLLDEQD